MNDVGAGRRFQLTLEAFLFGDEGVNAQGFIAELRRREELSGFVNSLLGLIRDTSLVGNLNSKGNDGKMRGGCVNVIDYLEHHKLTEEKCEVLKSLAKLYAEIIMCRFCPSLSEEISILISMLCEAQPSEKEKRANEKSDFPYLSSFESRIYFSVFTLENCLPLVEILGESIIQSLCKCKRIEVVSLSFYKDLVEMERKHAAENKALTYDDGSREEDQGNIQVGIPYDAEREGKHSFITTDSLNSNAATASGNSLRSSFVYSNRQKARDQFFSLIRQWDQLHSNFRNSSEPIKDMFGMMDRSNYSWFAHLFYNQILLMCCSGRGGEGSEGNLVGNSGRPETNDPISMLSAKNPDKLHKLNQRFSGGGDKKNMLHKSEAPPSGVVETGKTPSAPEFHNIVIDSLFQEGYHQKFFAAFVVSADSFTFNQHLANLIISDILELNSDFTRGSHKNPDVALEKLVFLGKFLGLLFFYPYFLVPKCDLELIAPSSLSNIFSLDLKDVIEVAFEKGHLSTTLPWVFALLSVVQHDPVAKQFKYLQGIFTLLNEVYFSQDLELKNERTGNSLRTSDLVVILLLEKFFGDNEIELVREVGKTMRVRKKIDSAEHENAEHDSNKQEEMETDKGTGVSSKRKDDVRLLKALFPLCPLIADVKDAIGHCIMRDLKSARTSTAHEGGSTKLARTVKKITPINEGSGGSLNRRRNLIQEKLEYWFLWTHPQLKKVNEVLMECAKVKELRHFAPSIERHLEESCSRFTALTQEKLKWLELSIVSAVSEDMWNAEMRHSLSSDLEGKLHYIRTLVKGGLKVKISFQNLYIGNFCPQSNGSLYDEDFFCMSTTLEELRVYIQASVQEELRYHCDNVVRNAVDMLYISSECKVNNVPKEVYELIERNLVKVISERLGSTSPSTPGSLTAQMNSRFRAAFDLLFETHLRQLSLAYQSLQYVFPVGSMHENSVPAFIAELKSSRDFVLVYDVCMSFISTCQGKLGCRDIIAGISDIAGGNAQNIIMSIQGSCDLQGLLAGEESNVVGALCWSMFQVAISLSLYDQFDKAEAQIGRGGLYAYGPPQLDERISASCENMLYTLSVLVQKCAENFENIFKGCISSFLHNVASRRLSENGGFAADSFSKYIVKCCGHSLLSFDSVEDIYCSALSSSEGPLISVLLELALEFIEIYYSSLKHPPNANKRLYKLFSKCNQIYTSLPETDNRKLSCGSSFSGLYNRHFKRHFLII
eukprot:Nk52_evm14s252 gene=Nk52_evmTU14s252